MISARLVALARCPDCHGTLTDGPVEVVCRQCGRTTPRTGRHLDLRPREAFAEHTKYLEASLHADARHETVSAPLLSAGVRNRMLRRFLAVGPEDRLIDLGCGSGRVLVWNRDRGAFQVGLDVSPYFAEEAQADVDLVLGDLRRLPFGDAAFTRAVALDVLEHLSREALVDMLREAARVLEAGGQLFVYSHVRRNSVLAGGLRAINAVARRLERLGWIDLSQERLRKSDHVNPLADIDDLRAVVSTAGLRVAGLRYYTPLVGGLIENIVIRLAEQRLARRLARRSGRATAPESGMPAAEPGVREADGRRAARAEAKRLIAGRGATYAVLRALTWLMMLDVALFGRVRSGPFFALLEKPR